MVTKKPMKGNTRVTGKEQFYTPLEVASSVVQKVLKLVPGSIDRPWLEPCAGSGNFLLAIRREGVRTVVGFDLHPASPEIKQQDFFSFTTTETEFVTATNPPFGRNNALSIPFFNHASSFSSVIAFIVPRSWRKWSVQNRLNRHFHLISDDDLSINYVDALGKPISDASLLRTCLQVWVKKRRLRPIVAVEDRGLIRKVSPQEADIALTIFGRGCGQLSSTFDRGKKVTTQMYLKLTHPDALTALQTANFGKYFNRVAYTEALSILEVRASLNQVLFGDELLYDGKNEPGLFEEEELIPFGQD
jgi:predicted RNA methylase